VGFTERLAPLGVETLSFQVLVALGALEALAVVVVVEGLYPTVAGLYGEAAPNTLGGEEVIPVGLAVGQTILQVEGSRAEHFATVGAAEALRVELLPHRVQAVALDALVTLGAGGGQEPLVAVLAVQAPLLLHEAGVQQGPAARLRGALEVVRAPVLAQRCHKRPPDLTIASGADGDAGALSRVHDAPTPLGGGATPYALGGHRPDTWTLGYIRQDRGGAWLGHTATEHSGGLGSWCWGWGWSWSWCSGWCWSSGWSRSWGWGWSWCWG